MSDSAWFYLREDGQQEGPVSAHELLRRLRSGLPADTLVWRDGLGEWTPASGVAELGPRRPPLAPGAPRGPAAAGGAGDEPRTLNPFRLWRRSLNLNGRFSRGEYAVAYFGTMAAVFVTVFAVVLAAAVAGVSDDVMGAVAVVLALLWLPVMLVASIGGGIRRLHDLGKPGWYIVFTFLPCLNIVMLLYMLFAPGVDQPYAGDSVSGVVVAVVAVFALIVVGGIVAAIAIPSLLRARVVANEAAAIGDLRALVSGQHAYATANGGFFDAEWSCLAAPAGCVPGHSGEPFIAPELTVTPKSGYVRELHAGQRFAAGAAPAGVSPSSTNAFVFVAYPAAAGRTGVRAFCADSSGRMCAAADGSTRGLVETLSSEPWVRCRASCPDLRR